MLSTTKIESNSKSIGAIILAAGESARMGRPKQKLRFCGESLLRRACYAALDSHCDPIVVILGAHSEVVNQELVDLPITVALNSDWPEGLSSTIRCGIDAINQGPQPPLGALLMLADQPLITSIQLVRLIEAFRKQIAPIVASQYLIGNEVVRGVPAVFGFELFPELLSLRGRDGAKPLIRKYELRCNFISMPEAVVDIDTAADFERAESHYQSLSIC